MGVGLLNTERRRRSLPLAAQGAIVMGIGLGIAYLMPYQLTAGEMVRRRPRVVRRLRRRKIFREALEREHYLIQCNTKSPF